MIVFCFFSVSFELFGTFLNFYLDHIGAHPEAMKSGKQTEDRFLSALRAAGLDVERELKRDFNVKPNEALSKVKPRGIISAGDNGVVRHVFDAGVLERIVFENPVYENRSMKHASCKEFARRFRRIHAQL